MLNKSSAVARAKLYGGMLFILAVIWSVAAYDLQRSRDSELRSTEQITVFQAQAFCRECAFDDQAHQRNRPRFAHALGRQSRRLR